jgi:hypothetical protein
MAFYLNFEAPSCKTKHKISELSFLQFKELNKYILNNNDLLLEKFIDELIETNLEIKKDIKTFTNYDKFCLMVLQRTICIAPDLEFTEKNQTHRLPLTNFLKQIFEFNIQFKKTLTIDNITVELGLPTHFVYDNFLDLSTYIIQQIKFENEVINFNTLKDNEKDEVLKLLPASIIFEIKNFYETIIESFKQIKFKLPTIEEDIELNPFNKSLLDIIKYFFKTNLTSLYEMQYFIVSKIFYTPEYVDKNTFVENIMLLNLFEKEQKKIEEQQNKQNQPKIPGKL